MLNEPVPHQSPDGVIAGYVILFVSRLLPLATAPRSAQQRTVSARPALESTARQKAVSQA